jgi:hypothetical protein
MMYGYYFMTTEDTNDLSRQDAQNRQGWERIFREAIVSSAKTDVTDAGLSRILERIRQEQRQESARPRARASWRARLDAYLMPGLAFACAVMVLQGVTIAWLWPSDASPEYAGVRGTAVPGENTAFLHVVFRPDATEREIRALLTAIRADIVAGPSQLGDYYLLLPPDTRDASLQKLAAHAIVEYAAPVDTLPADH